MTETRLTRARIPEPTAAAALPARSGPEYRCRAQADSRSSAVWILRSETGPGVPSACAKRLTRSSSIIQRTARASALPRPEAAPPPARRGGARGGGGGGGGGGGAGLGDEPRVDQRGKLGAHVGERRRQ